MVLMSACIPAPPPESEPATVTQHFSFIPTDTCLRVNAFFRTPLATRSSNFAQNQL